MDRNDMIELLVELDFQDILDGNHELLDTYLRLGFAGYENLSDRQLLLELEEREVILQSEVDFLED